jgi:hypothetical protein
MFSATATDNAGNVTTVSVRYAVDYFFVTLVKLLVPGPSVKSGMALNVSFQVFDTSASQVTNAAALLLVDGAPATPSGSFNSGDQFRYDLNSLSYRYKLSTIGLSVGIHLLTIVLDDGTRRDVSIGVGAPAPPPLNLSPFSTNTGSLVGISGTGYAPGSQVIVRLNGLVVATVRATSTGAFSTTVVVPATAPLGVSSFTADGAASDGSRLIETGWLVLTG